MSVSIALIVAAILAGTGGVSIGALLRQPEINSLKAAIAKLQEELTRVNNLTNSTLKDIEIIRLKLKIESNEKLLQELKGTGTLKEGSIAYAYCLKEYIEIKIRFLLKNLDITQEQAEFVDAFSIILDDKVSKSEEEIRIKEFIKEFIFKKYKSEIDQLIVPDLKALLAQLKKEVEEKGKEETSKHHDSSSFKIVPELSCLSLNEEQMRFLYSMQLQVIEYDIKKTKDGVKRSAKILWKNQWEKAVLEAIGKANSLSFFIRNEESLYSQMATSYESSALKVWYYLIAFESMIFVPYFALSDDKDAMKLWKNLKLNSRYMHDCFCAKQTIISNSVLDSMIKTYNKNINYLLGKSKKIILSIAITTLITIVTGGVAGLFAPSIAVTLVGGGMSGLYGAALTNASLAFIGGGALAAGGLGMAGGTAIIAGGGALFGMAASGATTASLSAIMLLTSKGYVLRECAKLLTFTDIVLIKAFDMKATSAKVQRTIEEQIKYFAGELSVLESQNKSDRKVLQNMEQNIKYLQLCNKKLQKIVE